MIDPAGRYAGLPTAIHHLPDGRVVSYVLRRFISPPERFALLHEHTVRDGDRPDLLANDYLGDPEQYWRIADANAVIRPDDLTRPGDRIRITLPDGVPGVADA